MAATLGLHVFWGCVLKITLLMIRSMPDQPDLLFLLHDLARHLRLEGDRRAAAHGMTRAQWVTLDRKSVV